MKVAAWLDGLGLGQYAQAFAKNGVDADVLPHLTPEDLKEIGISAVGDRRKLVDAISALRTKGSSPIEAESAPQPMPGHPAGQRTLTRSREAERRQLTVMFVDLTGSTALSNRFDPEEMGKVLRFVQGRGGGRGRPVRWSCGPDNSLDKTRTIR